MGTDRTRCAWCGTAVFVIAAATQAASAQPPPPGPRPGSTCDLSVFYESLASSGEWLHLAPYGWVWSPRGIDPDWRPYLLGHWVYTEFGWTWVSDEPFGWAVYHYGRWLYHPYHGWVWIPGTQWGPAWVAWRRGAGWIGWAALPPERDGGTTFRVGVEIDIGPIKRFSWCFVEEPRFCETNLRRHIVRSVRNVPIVDLTRNVTRYTVSQSTVINQSVTIEQIRKRVAAVPTYRVVDADSAAAGVRVDPRQKVLAVFRPRIAEGTPRNLPTAIIPAPSGRPPAAELASRRDAELRALEARARAERQALEERQQRELTRWTARGLNRADILKWHAQERAALTEQIDRHRKLVERSIERDERGETGRTKTVQPKFRH